MNDVSLSHGMSVSHIGYAEATQYWRSTEMYVEYIVKQK